MIEEWKDCDLTDDPTADEFSIKPSGIEYDMVTEEMRKAHREQFGLDGAFDSDARILDIQSIKAYGVQEKQVEPKNKYERKVKGVYIDVYDVLKAFKVTNPATQHAIKKLLAGGKRGYKNTDQDYHEAIASIYRAIELEDGEN